MHVHPLDLPEIVRRIQQHIRLGDLTTCIRVCRQWHDAFVPYVWKIVPSSDIIMDEDYYRPSFCSSKLSVAALQKHAHLVRSLGWYKDTDAILTELDVHHNIVFSNLEKFSFSGHNTLCDLFPAFLKRHPIVSGLNMYNYGRSMEHRVEHRMLQTILNHPTPLKHLNIASCFIDRDNVQLFWRACTLPEHLEISGVAFTWVIQDEPLLGLVELVDRDVFASLDFSRVKFLSMFEFELPSVDHIEIIAKCTRLERLYWGPWSQSNNPRPHDFSTRVANLGSRGCLRHLKDFRFLPSFNAISDPELAILLDSINLECGDVSHHHDGGAYFEEMTIGPLWFGPRSFISLQRHFLTITRLDMPKSHELTSAMIQQILCGCPNLTEYKASILSSSDLVTGEYALPWACARTLRHLMLRIVVEAASVEQQIQHNRAVLKQLGNLIALDRLDLLARYKHTPDPPGVKELSLSLEHGLDLLQPLGNRLKYATFQRGVHNFGAGELQWAEEYWSHVKISQFGNF